MMPDEVEHRADRFPRKSTQSSPELLEHMPGPGIIRRQKIREALNVVPSTAPPWHLTQIKPVVDAVVHERRESLLIDRVPQAQLGGNSIIEPVQQREAVASLRRG